MEYDLPRDQSIKIIDSIIFKSKEIFSSLDMNLIGSKEEFEFSLTSRNSPYSILYAAKMDFELIESENKTIVKYKISNTDTTNFYFILLPILILGIIIYATFNLNELSTSIGVLTIIVIGYLISIGMNRMDRGIVFERYKRSIEKELRKAST